MVQGADEERLNMFRSLEANAKEKIKRAEKNVILAEEDLQKAKKDLSETDAKAYAKKEKYKKNKTQENSKGKGKRKGSNDSRGSSNEEMSDINDEELEESDSDASDMLSRPLVYKQVQPINGAREGDVNHDNTDGANGAHPIDVDDDDSEDSASSDDDEE